MAKAVQVQVLSRAPVSSMKRSLLLLILLAGCAQNQSPAPALRALGGKVTVDSTYSDESIGFEARRRLNLAGPAELASVIIEVDDGVVVLRGTAPNRQAAWRAEGAARSAPGVKKVLNKIQLHF